MDVNHDGKDGQKQQKTDSMSNSSLAQSVTVETEVVLKKEVGLLSGISLIVGTIIGSGIFISPKGVLDMTQSVGLSLVVWTGSGVLAMLGALTYSELGTLVRKSGGEYAYILEAFGQVPAFLFAWTSVIVIRPSSIAIICLTFSEYLTTFFPYCGSPEVVPKVIAAVAIVTLMVINSMSVTAAARVQILFTAAKLGALVIVMIGGIVRLAQGHTTQFQDSFAGSTSSPSTIALAFYQALWAYDGWNNLNYVTEEIYKPEINLPRANILGVALVTVVYVLTNIGYLTAMTSSELLASSAVAVTWADRVLKSASVILPIAVLFSTFGAANGSVFTGGRVVYCAGREGHLPELLSYVYVRRLTPLPSIVFTCAISLVMIGISNIGQLVDFFSFTAWLFYGLTALSLLVMRYTKRDEPRIVRVPIVIPIIFLLCAIYLVIAPIVENPQIQFLYASIFIVGGLIFYVPLVHFKLVKIDKLTMYMQLFMEIAPPHVEPDS
ncbi:b(0,+)-type amino acid transporter 1-like isoform X1 [Dreissena polymorpha]|uniref:b(0,+)-type amino acid transporter 1-like isoform X1 n=1 Tax=Dreissena polymorpha TaxID=45954 RepID=UPI00226507DE|nr:b(0,+)-type amino acid transporter 1-like isoform X1 [Dreissena polymorpha]